MRTVFSKFPRYRRTLRSVVCCLSLVSFCGAGLPAQEENGEVFKKMAREDLGRMQKQDEKAGNDDLKDSLGVNSSFSSMNQPLYIGAPYPSALLKEEKDKEKEEEEGRKRNWLVDTVRKLSGEQELTDEEKEKLKNLSGDLNLVDRYVAERLREQLEKEEANAAVQLSEGESFEESEEEYLLGTSGQNSEIFGLSKAASTDPLKALEEKFISDAFRKVLPNQNRGSPESEFKTGGNNPFLENPDFSGIQFGNFNFLTPSPSLSDSGANAKPSIAASGSAMKLSENLSFSWLQNSKNPFLSFTLPEVPGSNSFLNPANGILPTFTDNSTTYLPTSNVPDLRQPAPKKPVRPLDDNEKKYFPQLNRF